MHRLLDVALLVIDGLVLLSLKPYMERAVRMAFSARAMRFVTISAVMRRLAGALFQTVVPILTVLGFCEQSWPFRLRLLWHSFATSHRHAVLWRTRLYNTALCPSSP